MYNHVRVKVADIKAQYGSDDVSQVKSMQLFIVKGKHSNKYLLISYRTLIGVLDEYKDCWMITNTYYSRTTSKQIARFKRDNYHCIVDPEIMDRMLGSTCL